MKVGDIIKVMWHGKLIDAEIIAIKHGVPNIKPIDK
jgi:hypothetical protein